MIEDCVQTFADPRTAAGQHLPRDQSEAVHVDARVEIGAVDLFGGHVGRSAERDTGNRQRGVRRHRPGEAEIGEQSASVAVDEDVFRLHVAVDDAVPVRGVERAADFAYDLRGVFRDEPALLLDPLLQRLTDDVGHDDREAGRTEIEHRAHGDDVGIVELGDKPRFACKPGLRFLIVDVSGPNELDRDLVTRRALPGEVNQRRTAAAQLANDLVVCFDRGVCYQ